MDPNTRARKLARLDKLRREVATLEQELGLGGPDGNEPAARAIPEHGCACDASDGSASDVCTSDEDSSDVDFSDEDAEEPLRLRGGASFTGQAGSGFSGGHPPIPGTLLGLAHVHVRAAYPAANGHYMGFMQT